jgi:dipeptidyl aminopeptidase/acylaminoacyl peptidase
MSLRSLLIPVALLLAATPSITALGQAVRPVRANDYYRLVDVSAPAMAPDGSRVAYVRTTVDEAENRRRREIWLVGADGMSEPRRLTSPGTESFAPAWHPNSQLLAFRSIREGEVGTWFIDLAAGGEAFQINGVEGYPWFSPDGLWIAFTRPTPPTGEAAARTRSGRNRYETVGEDAELVEARFTGRAYDWMRARGDGAGYLPDPRDALASPASELYVLPLSGGRARQITRLGVDVSAVAWDPTSTRLAFVADTRQRDEHTYRREDLWIVERAGGVSQITDDDNVHRAPRWMPDGESVVVQRSAGLDRVIADGAGQGAPVDLVQISVAGGGTTNLTPAWDLRPGPVTIDDAGVMQFTTNVGGQSHRFRIDPSGAVEQITTGRRWLTGFDADAGSERVAYLSTTSTRPVELFAATIDGTNEVQLTRHNEVLRSQVILSAARPISFASTDGQEIEGWIILPPGILADGPAVPLILSAHGGPHGAYGERFTLQFQLWATAGYAVLFTNPRGSTGYGEDFLWATWGGGWGGLDYEDVMSGVGFAIETYNIDTSRLGVTGYSYGGFLTNWLITQTDRFAAAISGAGISNWISDYGTADVPQTKESEFYGPPWKPASAELLWERSPVKHADGVSTPTLFLHGENDFRVPIEQAEQMYTALRKQNVPARFVRYPDTSHGRGSWRPWDMVHRYTQELDWWRRYFDAE